MTRRSIDTEDSRLVVQNEVKNATTEVRMGFIRKVYGILTFQLLLTTVVAAPLSQMQAFVMENIWLLYLSIAMTFITICAMSCCQNITRSFPTNYLFLFVFTGFEGVLVGFVSSMYTPESVLLAAGVTVLIFLGMTIYAWTTKSDFTGMGPYLFAALLALMCFGFILSILRMAGVNVGPMMMLYDLAGILIFTFYIVYDTQMILGEHGGHKNQFGIDDYVFASLNLYLDIINLFLHLLRLFGQRR